MKFKEYLKENWKSIVIKLSIFAVCLAVDLITKAIAFSQFSERFSAGQYENVVLIKGVLSFTYTENTGAAFSIFSNSTLFLTLFSAIFIAVFVWIDYSFKDKSPLSAVAVGLIIAGAFGNLIDRLFLHYVRDFISFDFLGNFPICNFADVCISVGCVMYAIYFIVVSIKNGKKSSQEGEK